MPVLGTSTPSTRCSAAQSRALPPVAAGAVRQGRWPVRVRATPLSRGISSSVVATMTLPQISCGRLCCAAKFHHGGGSLDTKLRLQGSGLVINAGVNDAAVVSALVPGDGVFLLDQQQSQIREQAGGVHRGRETYDSSTDDDDVETLIRHNGAQAGIQRQILYTWSLECEVTAVIAAEQ